MGVVSIINRSAAQLCEARNELDITTVIEGISGTCGFNAWTWTRIESSGKLSTVDTRPRSWQERYRKEGYGYTDAVAIKALAHAFPFTWDQAVEHARPTAQQKRIFAEARDHGMHDGLMIPIHSGRGASAFLGFTTDRPCDMYQIVQESRHALHYFGLAASSVYYNLHGSDRDQVELTARECECLLWAAKGKTVSETASILKISEHTVKAHVQTAADKLDAVNKVHAVVKATVLGLIKP